MIKKYTRVEGQAQVVSPEAHQAIQTELSKLGNTSARELSDSQRLTLREAIELSDEAC